MRVFDCVILNGELDMLQARFREYEDIPEVIHVIAEAAADYAGNPKPLHFIQSPLAGQWRGKWNHIRVEAHELPEDASPRDRKNALREYLAQGVNGDPDDIVLHGGMDEFPAPWVIRELLSGKIKPAVSMEMRHCAYRADLIHPVPWRGTVAQEWRYTGSFAGIRERRAELPAILAAGTRLSMYGGEVPEDGKHPDGKYLWETEVDESWPSWVRGVS